jgi:hypothetical protein
MISNADKQMVLKLDDPNVLNSLVKEHVCAHKRFQPILEQAGITPDNTNWASDEQKALLLLELLNEHISLSKIKSTDWNLKVGSAKKVIAISEKKLPIAICKALVIYVRKFL